MLLLSLLLWILNRDCLSLHMVSGVCFSQLLCWDRIEVENAEGTADWRTYTCTV